MTLRLKPVAEQVIVLTGASSGIGLATARMAAERGARLVLVARNAEALRAIAAECTRRGGRAIAAPADVAKREDVERVARIATEAFGGFMGLGEDYYTLPWSVLKYNTQLDAYELNLTEDQLRGAPRRSSEGRDASFDREWEEHVHRYYNATPYWGI